MAAKLHKKARKMLRLQGSMSSGQIADILMQKEPTLVAEKNRKQVKQIVRKVREEIMAEGAEEGDAGNDAEGKEAVQAAEQINAVEQHDKNEAVLMGKMASIEAHVNAGWRLHRTNGDGSCLFHAMHCHMHFRRFNWYRTPPHTHIMPQCLQR
jgi:hypothetical protein